MARIDFRKREATLNIVYVGPPMSGKSSNLIHICEETQDEIVSSQEWIKVGQYEDPGIRLDFTEKNVQRKAAGFAIRFSAYTLPGHAYGADSWSVLLRDVDVIVFVADSRFPRMEANAEAFAAVKKALQDNGLCLELLPHVFQWNHRDSKAAVPVKELDAALNQHKAKIVEATASKGKGVLETLKVSIDLAVEALEKEWFAPREIVR